MRVNINWVFFRFIKESGGEGNMKSFVQKMGYSCFTWNVGIGARPLTVSTTFLTSGMSRNGRDKSNSSRSSEIWGTWGRVVWRSLTNARTNWSGTSCPRNQLSTNWIDIPGFNFPPHRAQICGTFCAAPPRFRILLVWSPNTLPMPTPGFLWGISSSQHFRLTAWAANISSRKLPSR